MHLQPNLLGTEFGVLLSCSSWNAVSTAPAPGSSSNSQKPWGGGGGGGGGGFQIEEQFEFMLSDQYLVARIQLNCKVVSGL